MKKEKRNNEKTSIIVIFAIAFFILVVFLINTNDKEESSDAVGYSNSKYETNSVEREGQEVDPKKALSYCYEKANECAVQGGEGSAYLESVLEKEWRSACFSIYSAYYFSDSEKLLMSDSEIEEWEVEQYNAVMKIAEDLC
jgi:hypothetical protein